eukprot:8299086-Alexandrium_andersonii.AAC.1
MSASLVGSEMCIRDSAKTGFGLTQVPARPPFPSLAWRRRPRRCRRGQRPVSYTHLTLPTICSV